MAIQPANIMTPGHGAYTGTMKKYEIEAAAALVVRLHHVSGWTEWTAFEMPQLATLVRIDPVAMFWSTNIMWRPDVFALQDQGYMVGWVLGDPTSKAVPTDKFFTAFVGSIWVRSSSDGSAKGTSAEVQS